MQEPAQKGDSGRDNSRRLLYGRAREDKNILVPMLDSTREVTVLIEDVHTATRHSVAVRAHVGDAPIRVLFVDVTFAGSAASTHEKRGFDLNHVPMTLAGRAPMVPAKVTRNVVVTVRGDVAALPDDGFDGGVGDDGVLFGGHT